MYITSGGTGKIGSRLVEYTKFLPEFIVRNKLSSKPQKAAQKLKEMVEGKNSICKKYDLSIYQDYGKNTVRLNLLDQSFGLIASGVYPAGTDKGQKIVKTAELPVTAAVKRYTDVVKQMVENTK